MKPALSRHERTLMCIAAVLFISSMVLRPWLRTTASSTLLICGCTCLIAGRRQYYKRIEAAPPTPQPESIERP